MSIRLNMPHMCQNHQYSSAYWRMIAHMKYISFQEHVNTHMSSNYQQYIRYVFMYLLVLLVVWIFPSGFLISWYGWDPSKGPGISPGTCRLSPRALKPFITWVMARSRVAILILSRGICDYHVNNRRQFLVENAIWAAHTITIGNDIIGACSKNVSAGRL